MGKLPMKQMSKEERPEERLLQNGAQSLTNQELLALILRSGTKGMNVLDVAGNILATCGGIGGLRAVAAEDLVRIPGIGRVKAVQLYAVSELCKRMSNTPRAYEMSIRSPSDCADYVMEDMRDLDQEHFVCLLLNTKNCVIARKTVFIGSLNASIVHPRELYREAVRYQSASMICVHNHPSGVRLSVCNTSEVGCKAA
ncbi:MAG: RadC family protein [Bacilli bacterium]